MSRDIFIFNNRNNPAEGYYQVTEEKLQLYKKSCDGKPYIINLGYALMEVTEADYKDFYRVRRREKYLREEAQLAGGVISLNAIDSDELDGVGVVADTSEPLDEKIMRKIMIEKLPEAISVLSDEEKEIIRQLYFNHISERDLGKILGVPRTTISYRKDRALKKLKKFFEF
ncbi:MAG: sigma-70 family RNA polymerase sigma factor [Clostridia bacterium]|nr:sigma-70 family RNA polymerase sigma factor [Clostridia bacterium]